MHHEWLWLRRSECGMGEGEEDVVIWVLIDPLTVSWRLQWAEFQTLLPFSSGSWPVQETTVHRAKRDQWCNSLAAFPALLPQHQPARWHRPGQSAMVSCQKRALLLCCTWLECNVMLRTRTSVGSHISSAAVLTMKTKTARLKASYFPENTVFADHDL